MKSGSKPLIRVRRAMPADSQAVLELQQSLFAGDVNSLSAEALAAPDDTGRLTVLVGQADTVIVGFLVLRNRGTRPWTGIDFVGVAPQASGRGVGGHLVEAACFVSRRPVLRLFVRPSNIAARALYARLGFRHTATRKANYADGEDALVMMKWVGLRPFRQKPSNLEEA